MVWHWFEICTASIFCLMPELYAITERTTQRQKGHTRIRHGVVGKYYFVDLLPLFTFGLSRMRFPSALYLVFHLSGHAIYLFIRLCFASPLAHVMRLKCILRLKDRLTPWALLNEMILVEMCSVAKFRMGQCVLSGKMKKLLTLAEQWSSGVSQHTEATFG